MRVLFFATATFATINAITIEESEMAGDEGIMHAVKHVIDDKESQECLKHFLGAQQNTQELNAILAEMDEHMDEEDNGFEFAEEEAERRRGRFKKLVKKATSVAKKIASDPAKAMHCAKHGANSAKQAYAKLHMDEEDETNYLF